MAAVNVQSRVNELYPSKVCLDQAVASPKVIDSSSASFVSGFRGLPTDPQRHGY